MDFRLRAFKCDKFLLNRFGHFLFILHSMLASIRDSCVEAAEERMMECAGFMLISDASQMSSDTADFTRSCNQLIFLMESKVIDRFSTVKISSIQFLRNFISKHAKMNDQMRKSPIRQRTNGADGEEGLYLSIKGSSTIQNSENPSKSQ